ncbi:MAG: hypothetical protein H6719_02225 [Sandaracinaceae bacterium]|nr:hypothetical protein [Sandaracinaceae bacterium]
MIHAVSLALWVLALFAVFEASRALKLGVVGALAATLLVGLHPAQVEAVTWATGRKDILALGFSALAVVFHCRAEEPFDRHRLASLAAFAAAALSKTSALPLPLVLLAADVFVLRRDWRRSLLGLAPFVLAAAALGAFTIWIWSDAEMTRELSLGQRIGLVLATLSHDLATAVFPSTVSPLYPIHREGSFSVTELALGPLALGALSVAAWRSGSAQARFGVVAFVLLLLPVSNVIPLYFQWQDRYLSLPLWPLALIAGAGIDFVSRAKGPRWPAWAMIAALAGLLGARTAQYAGRWRDATTLFGHAAATHPESFYAWLNLGHARMREGHLEGGLSAYSHSIDAANLGLGHDARFRALLLIDERDRHITPSRADELVARFHALRGDPDRLRELAGDLAVAGYRRAVMLTLDYSLAQSPIPNDALERAAAVQLERGNEWLADYYLSRLPRPPVLPSLVQRVQNQADAGAPEDVNAP